MAIDRDERFGSGAEFAGSLEAIAAGQPLPLSARRSHRRNRRDGRRGTSPGRLPAHTDRAPHPTSHRLRHGPGEHAGAATRAAPQGPPRRTGPRRRRCRRRDRCRGDRRHRRVRRQGRRDDANRGRRHEARDQEARAHAYSQEEAEQTCPEGQDDADYAEPIHAHDPNACTDPGPCRGSAVHRALGLRLPGANPHRLGWSSASDSQPTPGKLFRTSVRGPNGQFLIIDYTPDEKPAFGGRFISKRQVGQTAFGSATQYIFQGGTLPECQRARCIDYLVADPASSGGFGVLAGGPNFAAAQTIAQTTVESLTPPSDYGE